MKTKKAGVDRRTFLKGAAASAGAAAATVACRSRGGAEAGSPAGEAEEKERRFPATS